VFLYWISNLNSKYPLVVLLVWFVIFMIAIPVASKASSRFDASGGGVPNSEWERVTRIIATEFPQTTTGESFILVSDSSLGVQNKQFLELYASLLKRLTALNGISDVVRFDTPNSPIQPFGQVQNRFVTVTRISALYGNPALLENMRIAVREIVPKLEPRSRLKTPETQFLITGSSAVIQDWARLTESDVRRGELTALPLTAIVLIFAFGALIAAGLPIIVGVFSITVTLACVYVATFIMPVSSFAQSVVTLFGLGAGIDYALLVVNRFRESLETNPDPRAAALEATRSAGRSVVFSGLTVAIAMMGLLVPNLALVRSMGVAGLLTITVTVLVSITLLPALLGLLGERINFPRALHRFSELGRTGGFWGRWAERVMAHPIIWGSAATAFLLLLAAPALGMKLGYTGAFGLAPGVESRKGLELIRPLALAGTLDTFEVLIDLGKPNSFNSEARAKWRKLDASLSAWTDVQLVSSPFSLVRNTVNAGSNNPSTVSAINAADALSKTFISTTRRYLKLEIIPKQSIRTQDVGAWLDRIRFAATDAGFSSVLIGGAPKSAFEITQAITGAIPIAVGLVFIATFIVLAIAFGSILIPLKSIVLNSLSVAASYGIITMVFQNGFLAGFFNAPSDVGAIDVTLPLVMFAVIFGLSMDYEIFLLTRVQEGHLAGLDTREAVKIALERTAGVITSAALIMVIVFSGFIPGSVVVNKTIGLGLSVAVALDATIVRLILVPAFMVLAGKWNWWLPAWLRRVLPKVKLEH
jgi:putative drug exporter of the RND superfamily